MSRDGTWQSGYPLERSIAAVIILSECQRTRRRFAPFNRRLFIRASVVSKPVFAASFSKTNVTIACAVCQWRSTRARQVSLDHFGPPAVPLRDHPRCRWRRRRCRRSAPFDSNGPLAASDKGDDDCHRQRRTPSDGSHGSSGEWAGGGTRRANWVKYSERYCPIADCSLYFVVTGDCRWHVARRHHASIRNTESNHLNWLLAAWHWPTPRRDR